jgi:GTPase SAR1 family protein
VHIYIIDEKSIALKRSNTSLQSWQHPSNLTVKNTHEETDFYKMISAIKNLFAKPKSPYICVLGLDAAGKSTTMYKFKNWESVSYIRFACEKSTLRGAEFIALDPMPFSSETTNPRLHAHYLFLNQHVSKADAFVWIVDSRDRERFGESREEFEIMYKLKGSTTMPILFLANKQDLLNAATTEEICASHNLKALPNPWQIFKTEATSGEGLYEAFEWLFAYLQDLGLKITPPAERAVTAACEISY